MIPRGLILFFAAACAQGLSASGRSASDAAVRPAAPIDPSAPTAAELRAFAREAEQELRGNILPFWLRHAPNPTGGGFRGLISDDMEIVESAPRGTLLTSRILWTFSAATRRYAAQPYRAMADRAFRDLIDNGWDPEHGGVYWTVAPDGKPADTTKHVYGQAFAIYALSEYHRATADPAALERAIMAYRMVEAKARDRKHGGYVEGFTRDWVRDDTAPRRILGARGPKSQNTHIHVLEAYTGLLRIWPDDQLRADLTALLELMLTRIIDARTNHLVLYFADDWTPASHEVSYGHDIELSWLILEAAHVLGHPELVRRAESAALGLAAATVAEGLDRDGAVFNEGDASGVTNRSQDWWPQAEAIVGFLNAYQLSGDVKYYAAARRAWAVSQAKFVDRRHGDWIETVGPDGSAVPRPKLSVWKCPYHNGRACLEVLERSERLPRRP